MRQAFVLLCIAGIGECFLPICSPRLTRVKMSSNEDAVEKLLKEARALREEAAMLESELPNRSSVVEVEETLPRPVTTRRARMQNETLREGVRRQLINAFDNIPPQEVSEAFDTFWAQGPSRTVDTLIELAQEADAVENAYFSQKISPENAADLIRSLRSRLRMWSKEFVQPVGDASFNLIDWLANRTKTE